MAKQSAGILLYKIVDGVTQVLFVHPGGPLWKNKDLGAWSIPKGEFLPGQDPLKTAKREFKEETGGTVNGEFRELTPVRQTGGKIVYAFAVEGDFDVTKLKSNTFPMEWPLRSGKFVDTPEVDRAEWFDLETARQKINAAQAAFIDQLEVRLRGAA
jgi:predicted NUDIX family NTP pyrophosphohydrolase